MNLELGDAVVVIDGPQDSEWWRGQNQRTFDIGKEIKRPQKV